MVPMIDEPLLPAEKFVGPDKTIRLQYNTRDGWSVWSDGQFERVGPGFWENLRAFIRAWRAK